MKSWFCVVIMLVFVGGFVGCLVFELFKVFVDVYLDGVYIYCYDGIVIYVLVVMQIKQKGLLLMKDEDVMKVEVVKGVKSFGVKKMVYLGVGCFELFIEQEFCLEVGNVLQIMKMISVCKDKDGSYIVSFVEIKVKDFSELKLLGIKIEGILQVIFLLGVQVIVYNVDSMLGLFNKVYVWKIGGLDVCFMLCYCLL